MERHPAARTWSLPPERPPLPRGLRRTNLRALAAREGRFEHHLMVVATVGEAQLEVATASEPLFFAHANVSDEYVVALATGDAMVDAFPMRVFLSDPASHEDVGRLKHGVNDLVLHPHGWLHWPGRLRPPFEPPRFPPGGRRAVLSLVFCGNRPLAPEADRPVEVSPGREADAKAYADAGAPLMIAALGERAPGVVARVGGTRAALAEAPFAPKRGGYVAVLEGEGDAWPGDLVFVPPGARWDGAGVARALLFESDAVDASPPPAVWERVPEPPFAPYERAAPGELPWTSGDGAVALREASDAEVVVRVGGSEARVPRYWLARMLFRVALHALVDDGARLDAPRPCLGYLETYGGFFYDDRDGYRLGVRGGDEIAIAADALGPLLEGMYRAAAPIGYVEDLR